MKLNRRISKTFCPQLGSDDCGQAALYSLLIYLGFTIDYSTLLDRLPPGKGGVSLLDLKKAAADYGATARCFQVDLSNLKQLGIPAIIQISNELRTHFVICYETRYQSGIEQFLIGDPSGYLAWFRNDEFGAMWQVNAALAIENAGSSLQLKPDIISPLTYFKMHGRTAVFLSAALLGLLLPLPHYAAILMGEHLLKGFHGGYWLLGILAVGTVCFRSYTGSVVEAIICRTNVRVRELITAATENCEPREGIPLLTDEITRVQASYRTLITTLLPDLAALLLMSLFLATWHWAAPVLIWTYVIFLTIYYWHSRHEITYQERQLADMAAITDWTLANRKAADDPMLYRRRLDAICRRQQIQSATKRSRQFVIDLLGMLITLYLLFLPGSLPASLPKATALFFLYLGTAKVASGFPQLLDGIVAFEGFQRRMRALTPHK